MKSFRTPGRSMLQFQCLCQRMRSLPLCGSQRGEKYCCSKKSRGRKREGKNGNTWENDTELGAQAESNKGGSLLVLYECISSLTDLLFCLLMMVLRGLLAVPFDQSYEAQKLPEYKLHLHSLTKYDSYSFTRCKQFVFCVYERERERETDLFLWTGKTHFDRIHFLGTLVKTYKM